MSAEPIPDEPDPGARTPPQDLDAERSVLGGMLLSAKAVDECQEILHGEDFYRPAHELVFAAIGALSSRAEPVDAITVVDELRRRGDLTRVGGAPFIHTLIAASITTANAGYHARIVRDVAVLRRIIEACMRGEQMAYAAQVGEAAEVVETVRAEIDHSSRSTATIRLVEDDIDATIDEIDKGLPPAAPTPWADLNALIDGWSPSTVTVVGARPGVGKTLMLLQAAISLSERGYVAYHSLEMSRGQLNMRLLSQMAGVSYTRMRRRTLSDHDWDRIAAARVRVPDLRLSVDDRGGVQVLDIRSHARTLARKGPLAAVVVDYIQLVSTARGDRRNRQEQIADWSRQLKLLSMELEVPVIVASQLNRNSEARTDRKPTIADLRESGALEQDSDVVLLLHVDERGETDPRQDAEPDPMDVHVAKNRYGATGHVTLMREGALARIDDVIPGRARPVRPVQPPPHPRDFTEPVHPVEAEEEPLWRG